MAVPDQTPYNIYTANGVTSVFPYEFYLIDAGDLTVSLGGGVVTTGFTVTGIGNVNGGEVTFLTAPADGVTVKLERVVAPVRLTEYQDNGDLLAGTVNLDFDRLWMAIRQAYFNSGRALRVPDTEIAELPPLAQLEGKLIGVTSGKPVGVLPESGSASDVMLQLAGPGGAAMIGALDGVNIQTHIDYLDLRVEEVNPATQLARDEAIAAKDIAIEAATDAQTAAGVTKTFATYAELSSVVGAVGQAGRVFNDNGTHVDPVSGETVPNNGMYTWNVSASAWAWQSADLLSKKANQSDVDVISLSAERSAEVTETLITDSDDMLSAVDEGFKAGFRIDPRGVLISPGSPDYLQDSLVRGATWGVADKYGFAPIWTGPASEGFPIYNPRLQHDLNNRLGRMPLIAFDGDSRIDQGVDSYRTNTIGIPYWLSFLSGGRFDVRDQLNLGLGGQTSTQVLSRVSATIAACRAYGCTKLIALFSLNDRGSAGAGNDGSTAAVTIANLEAYQTAVLDAGIDLIWVAELPCGNPDWQTTNPSQSDLGLTAWASRNQLAVRRWQLAQPLTHPRVSVADPFPLLVDSGSTTTINWKSGVAKDAKHMGPVAAYVIAKSLLPVIEQQLPPLSRVTSSALDVYTGDNPGGSLLSNTMLSGSGGAFSGSGTHTGTLPDNWSAAIPSGINADFSTVSDGNGDTWLQAAISGTATGTTWLTLTATANTVGLSSAGEYITVCEQQVDAGHSGLSGMGVRGVLTYAAGGSIHNMAGAVVALTSPADINMTLPSAALSGVAVAPPLAVTGATVSSARIDMLVQGEVGAVSATVRWRVPSINRLV